MLIQTEEQPFEFEDLTDFKEMCMENGIDWGLCMKSLSEKIRNKTMDRELNYELRNAEARINAKNEVARKRHENLGELKYVIDIATDLDMTNEVGSHEWITSRDERKIFERMFPECVVK